LICGKLISFHYPLQAYAKLKFQGFALHAILTIGIHTALKREKQAGLERSLV
jgi:hypothetical protein